MKITKSVRLEENFVNAAELAGINVSVFLNSMLEKLTAGKIACPLCGQKPKFKDGKKS